VPAFTLIAVPEVPVVDPDPLVPWVYSHSYVTVTPPVVVDVAQVGVIVAGWYWLLRVRVTLRGFDGICTRMVTESLTHVEQPPGLQARTWKV
jgi:hypothetical protein